jgi:hypothetical protein
LIAVFNDLMRVRAGLTTGVGARAVESDSRISCTKVAFICSESHVTAVAAIVLKGLYISIHYNIYLRLTAYVHSDHLCPAARGKHGSWPISSGGD